MKRINHTSSGENLIGILLSISFGIALILFDAGRTSAHSTQCLLPTDFNSYRIKVLQIYTSQIGFREQGVNTGPEVEKYLRYVNIPKGNPWCAAFVCWVFGQAGVANPRSGWSPDLFGEGRVIWRRGEPGTKSQESRLPQSALVGFFSNTIQNNRTATRCAHPPRAASEWLQPGGGAGGGSNHFLPTTGDIFGLYFPEKKRIAHVGFVDQWDGTWMVTVEGNTNNSGNREGDGVYRKRRLVRSIYKVARHIN